MVVGLLFTGLSAVSWPSVRATAGVMRPGATTAGLSFDVSNMTSTDPSVRDPWFDIMSTYCVPNPVQVATDGTLSGTCGGLGEQGYEVKQVGTVSGKVNFDAGTANVHLEVTLTRKATFMDASWTLKVTLDGSGSATARSTADLTEITGPGSYSYSCQASGPNITCNGLTSRSHSGSVPFAMYVHTPSVQPYRLSVTTIDQGTVTNGRTDLPNSYQPVSLRIVLERLNGTSYAAMPGAKVRVVNPWSDVIIPFKYAFWTPSCTNCTSVEGSNYERVVNGPGDIELKTDATGTARLVLYPNWPGYAGADILPSRTSAQKRNLQVRYYGDSKTPLIETPVSVTLGPIAVVESVRYAPAGLSPKGQQPASVPLDDPAVLKTDAGTVVGNDILSWVPLSTTGITFPLRGPQRVRLFPAGSSYLSGPGSEAPGEVLTAGTLLYRDDDLSLVACDLPARTEPNSWPAEVSVTIRYFDGLRARISVDREVCGAAIEVGKVLSELETPLKQKALLYVRQQVREKITSKVIGIYLKTFVPPLAELKTAVKVVGIVRSLVAPVHTLVYVEVNSSIAIGPVGDTDMAVTTREGNAVVYSDATGGKGVPVPTGSTAVLGADLKPAVKATDATTGARADDALAGLGGSDVAGADTAKGSTPTTSPKATAPPKTSGTSKTTVPSSASAAGFPTEPSSSAPWVLVAGSDTFRHYMTGSWTACPDAACGAANTARFAWRRDLPLASKLKTVRAGYKKAFPRASWPSTYAYQQVLHAYDCEGYRTAIVRVVYHDAKGRIIGQVDSGPTTGGWEWLDFEPNQIGGITLDYLCPK